jgi:hypothetical protein
MDRTESNSKIIKKMQKFGYGPFSAKGRCGRVLNRGKLLLSFTVLYLDKYSIPNKML